MADSKLSIIIPCYNCADTLSETVSSCFSGGLEDFEIIMVDDGSTDTTKVVMEKLARVHPEIKLYYHDQNRGGGATRNTGIQKSLGKVIFCLDADNLLDPHSIQKMRKFLHTSKSDGVAFYERRFFHSKNRNKYISNFYTAVDGVVTINNLFDDSKILLDNFLYTRESFLRTSGYPEHHGFDTQSFEMRYLSSGNIVRICPGTFCYHRQNHSSPSYFEREFNSGNFSINYYLAIEDIWDLLSPQAKKEIIMYDIFKYSNLQENIYVLLKKLYLENRLFLSQSQETAAEDSRYAQFDSFIKKYRQKKYDEALYECKTLLESGVDSKVINYAILRASLGARGANPNSIEKEVGVTLKSLITRPRKLNKWYHRNIITSKGIQLIMKILKNK